jgi:threonine aldolase
MIDLSSDMATRPSQGMLAAMTAAQVGDEQKQEDPTTNELQEQVAHLLGKELALFVPSATMANQIAIKVHTRPGDEIIAEQTSNRGGGSVGRCSCLAILWRRRIDTISPRTWMDRD